MLKDDLLWVAILHLLEPGQGFMPFLNHCHGTIDSMVATPLQADGQCRVSLLRYNLQVDFRPTSLGVDSVFKGLLTEFEQIAYLKGGSGDDIVSPKVGPKARAWKFRLHLLRPLQHQRKGRDACQSSGGATPPTGVNGV